MPPEQPNARRAWFSRWRGWWRPIQRAGLAVLALAIVAALAWYFWPDPESDRVYEVYARTTYANDDTSATAEDMRIYLTENFPPSKFEYLGIVAQRHPTSQSPWTTTYVLFRRK